MQKRRSHSSSRKVFLPLCLRRGAAQQEPIQQHRRHPQANRAVGKIERGPIPCACVKIKKIDNRAEAQPVDDIADRAADDEPDRDRQKGRAHPEQPDDQRKHDDRREHREDPEAERGLAGLVEHAEADAAVAGQHEIEERGDRNEMVRATRLAEVPQHPQFAELIKERHERRHGEAEGDHYPAAASGIPAPAPRSITSAQRWQRSSCPGTWPTSGNTRQQRSHRSPGASETTTPISGTSGRVKAVAGGGAASTAAAEVMHSSARSTSPSAATEDTGAKMRTAACRLDPMRFCARSNSRAPVTTRRTSRRASQRAAKVGSFHSAGTSVKSSRWTLRSGISP